MTTIRTVDPSVSRSPLPMDAADLPTVCVLCSHNCGLRVDVRNGCIAAVRADERNPITAGYVCNKAFSIGHYVEHAQRVRHPLRRRPDGRFERVSWETAIAAIAGDLTRIRETHGARGIGLVGIGGQANHMDAPYGVGFLRSLGSRKWFNAFAQEKTQHCLVDQWMFNASPTVWFHPDMERTQYLLVLGTNPRISNRGHNATESFQWFVKQPGRTMTVVDPRETETTRAAHHHLRVRPGTDAYLLLAMAAAIVRNELVDYEFVRRRTTGYDAVREVLATVDIDVMAARCGIAASVLVDTAAAFASADSAAIFFDLGVEQTPFSTLVSYLIRLLQALTGNIGVPGGAVFMETFAPPVVDSDRVRETERALASGIPAIRALGNAAMFSPTLCPDEILVDHPERLRALIVEGSNPFLSYSDTGRWREARERLELLVVIEPAMTETAQVADYVLPTPVGYEKWEIANFPRGYPQVWVQVRPPVVPGPAEALPEPEIYARLAEAMDLHGPPPAEVQTLAAQALEPEGAAAFVATAQGLAMQSGRGVDPATQLLFWAYRTVGPQLPAPSLVAVWLMCGLNAMLRPAAVARTLGAEWASRGPFEVAAELFRRILVHPEGVEVARCAEDTNLADHVGFGDGRVRLAPDEMLGEMRRAVVTPPVIDPAYPLVLGAGLRTRWTANTVQRDPAWRRGRGPHCALNVSPADAERLGLRDGTAARVSTRRGSLTLPVQIDAKVPDGYVWIPNGFGHLYPGETGRLAVVGVNTNELTDVADRDPFTGVPHHRYVCCRVEPVAA